MTTLTTSTPTVQSGQVQPGSVQSGPVQPGPVPALHGDEAEDIVQRSCLDIFCCCFSGRNISEADDEVVMVDVVGAGGGTAGIAGIANPNQEREEDTDPHGAGGATAGVGGAVGGVAAGPSTEEPQAVKGKLTTKQTEGLAYLKQINLEKQNAVKILQFCSNTLNKLILLEGKAFIDGLEREGHSEKKVKEKVIIDGKPHWITTTLRPGAFVQLNDLFCALSEIYPKKSGIYALSISIANGKLVEPLEHFYFKDLINYDEFNVGVEQGKVMLFVNKCIRIANNSGTLENDMRKLVDSLKHVLKNVLASCKYLENQVSKEVRDTKESEGQE